MPPLLIRLLKLLISFLLPLVLVVSSVRLLVTDQYLSSEYGKTDFPPDPFGFDQAQRLTYASANFEYVRGSQPIDALANQQSNGLPLYNARELSHMRDVQNVYQSVWRLWQIALALVLVAGVALSWRRETRAALAAAIQWGGVISAALVAVVGLPAVVAWRLWFVAFHKIFFAAGTWTFNYSDTLIRLFPENFWFDAAMTISGLTLIGGLLTALIGWLLREGVRAASTNIQPSTPQP
ncbi:MAG: TIGR01906 family membrane protein [Chloroflexi bacterium]|nr:TIGR01906 family membrane protein [Chloroflexota bacterium]